MKPRSGEKPPLISNSRSQIWRGVRSHEGHSRECALSSSIRSGCAISSASSPPCGGIRWLVEAVKSVNLPGPFGLHSSQLFLPGFVFQTARLRWFLHLRPGKENKRNQNSPAGGASRRRHYNMRPDAHCKILTDSSYERANAGFSTDVCLEQLSS